MGGLITPAYRAQLVEKHATKPWGGAGAGWVPEVVRMMLRYRTRPVVCQGGATTQGIPIALGILDYGAGRRTFSPAMRWLCPHMLVEEYDPGVPGIDTLPTGPYDFVVCTDVMEHVEEEFVVNTLRYIHKLTRYAVLFNICLSPSKSLLPDGRNAHLTVKPAIWWQERIGKVFNELEHVGHQKGYTLVAHNNSGG